MTPIRNPMGCIFCPNSFSFRYATRVRGYFVWRADLIGRRLRSTSVVAVFGGRFRHLRSRLRAWSPRPARPASVSSTAAIGFVSSATGAGAAAGVGFRRARRSAARVHGRLFGLARLRLDLLHDDRDVAHALQDAVGAALSAGLNALHARAFVHATLRSASADSGPGHGCWPRWRPPRPAPSRCSRRRGSG